MRGMISRKPVRKLFRRLSSITASSQYLLHSSKSIDLAWSCTYTGIKLSTVPVGYVPVHVGEECERFVVSTKLLTHPIFMKLLNKSAQEYGYEQEGVLRIPCHVLLFERLLESFRHGDESLEDE